MIERLRGDPARARSAEIARILALAFDDPGQRWSAASVASTLATPGAVALLAPGGCAVLRVAADEAELLTIGVAPDARRGGLGRALITACLDAAAAAGAERLHLEVAAGNGPALALYAALGFAETGRRRAYYAGPQGREDAVLMARTAEGGPPG